MSSNNARPGRTSPPPGSDDLAAASLRPAHLLALQAFDVAVRLGSFKEAAGLLNVGASAVSHRIRNLEAHLGVALFHRSHRAVRPTRAGEKLAAATGRAFALLARAESALEAAGQRRLRLKVLPQFASAWLIPRLSSFLTRHSELDLAIETSNRNVDFDTETFDAGISFGPDKPDGVVAHRLMEVRTVPVGAPALARRLKLRTAADLGQAVLIHVTTFPAAWPLWFKHAGAPTPHATRAISVDSFVAALQAAERGAGVALALEPFIGESERHGTIRRLLPVGHVTGSYWLVHPPGAQRNRALQTFKKWLLAELAKSD
ncbi:MULTISPECIES: LysR substrate-binding domain-containing protein [Bradyrhizobium]|jgi:DNA-binding transcriptional LysR family regulator|uniref:LysR substrate-binding domain-containing protein n=1 Tax=Bradyrhizobium TaxID=374 RepID=UPI000417D8D0|nr:MULTISPECIES: LysR substrate-binding domain-containing protein [Bradyrhizobium]